MWGLGTPPIVIVRDIPPRQKSEPSAPSPDDMLDVDKLQEVVL
jgi:hypothetical protein